MTFHAEPKGWGVTIESSYVGAAWLRDFLRTRRITPSDEQLAVELHDELDRVLRGE